MRILNDQQEKIVKEERKALNDLRIFLIQFGSESAHVEALNESILQLDELFLLVVVGEFNAGKSAFINALLGARLLAEGVTPTTTQINILKYGKEPERTLVKENQLVLLLPVEWLSEISIVDTPGTNAIIRSHEVITNEFVPRSDLVLFVTSADRPFTESERAFLERIRDWGKKIVIVINKIDILESEQEIHQVTDFVVNNAFALLDLAPEIFPASSRLALRAKLGEQEFWEASQFEPLEKFIRQTLDEKSRIVLKLLNPIGVGLRLTNLHLEIIHSRVTLLKEDMDMLADVEDQLQVFKQDMFRDFEFRMADIENVLYEMEQRGSEFFDQTFRLARVRDLISKDRVRKEFEQRVVSDAPDKIEQKVNELISWLVEANLRQWQAINEHLAQRKRAYQDRIVGDFGPGSFRVDRERLMDAVAREAQHVVETYDKETEAKAIADGAQDAVAASAVLEVGAVGLGALVTILATTVAADVTGILLATFIAALGLIIIPARRRIAKNDMRVKLSSLRIQLIGTLREKFEKEIQRSLEEINAAISPYSRFVRAEQGKLVEYQTSLEDIKLDLKQLNDAIELM